ncbi:hypothetical protein BV25DRAFT_1599086 [Artomyces pyxidatus]|uniref:Uncharacterized protein n=1 Tax=Artomyces pyxidatus TaxID=48021 RepID=A0ACB8TCA2_9AGAM|nr:hypothetical protein BV25DRAFT_1599086 [Artomyces pyxidatus]
MADTLPESLGASMGALLVGVVVSAALYGVTILQTAHYYHAYPADHWLLKTLVCAVLVIETVHQCFITHTVYIYLVTNYYQPAELNVVIWSFIAAVMLCGVTAVLVQSFLVYTIAKARSTTVTRSKNMQLGAWLAALVLAQFALTTAFTGELFVHVKLFTEASTQRGLLIAVNAVTTAANIAITACLTRIILKARSSLLVPTIRSEHLVQKLVVFIVTTGSLMAFSSVASLAVVSSTTNVFIFSAIYSAMGRFYANSLLAILNVRPKRSESFRIEDEIASGFSGRPVMMPRSRFTVPNAVSPSDSQPIEVKINRTLEIARDHDRESATDVDYIVSDCEE